MNVTAEQIPPEVEEAFAKAFNSWERKSNAECLAIALAAWPDAFITKYSEGAPAFNLPIPQEARDD